MTTDNMNMDDIRLLAKAQTPRVSAYLISLADEIDTLREKNRFQAEEAECAHRVLDGLSVPREDGERLSLVGRIKALQAITTIRRQVEAFCRAARHPVRDLPQTPPTDELKLRLNFVIEEFFELLEAIYPQLGDVNNKAVTHRGGEVLQYLQPQPDLVAVADAMADLDYVVEGLRLAFGINGAPIAEEVQRSNMEKFGPGSWKREDGKQMKPPGWTPPDIEGELRKQGYVPPFEEGSLLPHK